MHVHSHAEHAAGVVAHLEAHNVLLLVCLHHNIRCGLTAVGSHHRQVIDSENNNNNNNMMSDSYKYPSLK